MTHSWVRDAPIRLVPEVVAAKSSQDETFPGISLAFPGLPDDDVITVTVIGSKDDFRRFQKELDRAITKSLRGT